MIKRLATVVAVLGALVASLIATASSAFADTGYPAPPVTTSGTVGDPGTATSAAAALVSAGPSAPGPTDPLAYTGVPFNATYVAMIAALIVLVGAALVILGSRRAWKYRPRHGRH